jgi:uncharacterized protein YecT (DUF1311 family)
MFPDGIRRQSPTRLPDMHCFRTLTAVVIAATALSAPSLAAIDCEKAVTTPEIAWCAEQDLKSADAALNAAYREAIDSIKGASHLNSNQRRDWERALREAQRHWIAFSAKDCGEVMGWEWHGGTGRAAAGLACQAAKTRQRTEELKSRYSSR